MNWFLVMFFHSSFAWTTLISCVFILKLIVLTFTYNVNIWYFNKIRFCLHIKVQHEDGDSQLHKGFIHLFVLKSFQFFYLQIWWMAHQPWKREEKRWKSCMATHAIWKKGGVWLCFLKVLGDKHDRRGCLVVRLKGEKVAGILTHENGWR